MIQSRTPRIEPATSKAGWRVPQWCSDVGLSRASVYELIRDKTIASVKVGKSRIIVTSPADFLAKYADQG